MGHHPFRSLGILGNFNGLGNKNGCLIRTCPGNRVLFVLDPMLGWIYKHRILGPNLAEWIMLFPQCRPQHLIWAWLRNCMCNYPVRWWVMDMFKMGSGSTEPNNFLFFFLSCHKKQFSSPLTVLVDSMLPLIPRDHAEVVAQRPASKRQWNSRPAPRLFLCDTGLFPQAFLA